MTLCGSGNSDTSLQNETPGVTPAPFPLSMPLQASASGGWGGERLAFSFSWSFFGPMLFSSENNLRPWANIVDHSLTLPLVARPNVACGLLLYSLRTRVHILKGF